MPQQQGTPSRSVLVASLALVVAIAGFAAAFYYYDGSTYVSTLTDLAMRQFAVEPGAAPQPSVFKSRPVTTTAGELLLPSGMPQDFALRLWQEQVDSRPSIERLVSGEVSSLRVDGVSIDGNEARLSVTLTFADGTAAPGVIGMRRFGDIWYIAFASGMREGSTGGDADAIGQSAGGAPATPLPSLDEVDIPLLNALISEQQKSASITQEYVNGRVQQVNVESVEPGPSTVTMRLSMDEDHEESYSNLVAIRKDVDGVPYWFLARFKKTGSEAH